MVCDFCCQQYYSLFIWDNDVSVTITSDRYVHNHHVRSLRPHVEIILWTQPKWWWEFSWRGTLVSTRRRLRSRYKRINESWAGDIPKALDMGARWWHKLACSFLWFDPLRILFVKFSKSWGVWTWSQDSWRNERRHTRRNRRSSFEGVYMEVGSSVRWYNHGNLDGIRSWTFWNEKFF